MVSEVLAPVNPVEIATLLLPSAVTTELVRMLLTEILDAAALLDPPLLIVTFVGSKNHSPAEPFSAPALTVMLSTFR